MHSSHWTLVRDMDVFTELLLVLALHLGDARFELILGSLIEPFGAAGGKDHACSGASCGFREQAAAYHGRFSSVTSCCGWGAAARAWAPAGGNAAGADCGSSRTANRFWRRSNFRSVGHEPLHASHDTFRRGTG